MAKNNQHNRRSFTKDFKQEEQPKKKSQLQEWIETIVMAVILYFAIDFCIGRFRVENISMETSFTAGELVMVNKLNYKFSEPKRGDVVILHSPIEKKKDYIKRLIGLPGDHIQMKDGVLYINDEKIDEPWVHEPIEYSLDYTVADGTYLVLGDNRNHSTDGHVFGSVPKSSLVGNVFFRYWPLTHIKVINDRITLSADPTN